MDEATTRSPIQDATSVALLESLVVNNRELEKLEAQLAQFNIFESLGAVRHELRHSDFLAFLLDPNQNHGLGDEFARRLLQGVLISAGKQQPSVTPIELDVWNLSSLVVQREWRNIDILLLVETHKLAVIIENKIGSVEHSNQLQRYVETVIRQYPDWKLLSLYLTPDGDTPSDGSYIATGYSTICEIVEKLADRRSLTLGADIRTLMIHYTQMLRRHILTESPIAQLCRDIYKKHKNALDLIYEHRPDRQATVRYLLEGLISETPGLLLDHCTKSYVRFAPQNWDVQILKSGEGWTPSGQILLFEFENYAERLKLRLTIGPGPEVVRQGLFNMAQSHQPPFRLSSKSLYKKWNTIYDKSFLTPKNYEDTDDVELADAVRIHWARFLKNDLPLIIEVIREQHWIS